MANMKFSERKRKEVKGIIVKVAGDYKTYYNNIDELLQIYSEDEVVKIFNPTEEQKEKIITLALQDSNFDDKTDIKISDRNFLLELLELSSLECDLDVNIEKDAKQIDEILSDPDPLLIKVQSEITKIVMEVLYQFIENVNTVNETPSSIQDLQKVLIGNKKSEKKDITPVAKKKAKKTVKKDKVEVVKEEVKNG